MIRRVKTNEGIQYKKLSPEEMKARGILGRLVGPCADFVNPTRNGRKYSEQLWENVFNNPIMQEKIKNGVCFGELGHPADRTEIDMEKIAICLREQPVKNDKGQLIAVFDILDTPNGRILKALCDYGSTIGVSSRGQGDLVTDVQGNESVDPDTYECECWDAVLVPAVESARMQYMTEGLDRNAIKMKKALTESLHKASDEDRKVMEETLKELNIKLDESSPELAEPIEAKKFEDGDKTEVFTELPDYKVEVEQKGDKIEIELEPKKAEETEESELEVAPVEEIPEVEENEEEVKEALVEAKKEDKVEDEVVEEPIEEIPADDVEIAPEADAIEDTPVEEARSDKEVFLDFLANHFDEDKVKEVCDILDIECECEEDAEDKEESEEDNKEDVNDEEVEDINKEEAEVESPEEIEEAIDDRSNGIIKTLQEALKGKSDLEKNVKSLQEKLAVSDAKVNGLTEECDRYKKAVARLAVISKSNKDLEESVSRLEESLKTANSEIKEQKSRIARLVKSNKDRVNESVSLTESVTAHANETKVLNEKLNTANKEIQTLKAQLNDKDNESLTKINGLNESLNKATTLKESYKKLANKAVNKYIDIKAKTLGCTSNDIKRKLGESYTLEDVDAACEGLKEYQWTVSKLPFDITKNNVRVRVNENVKRSTINSSANDDDDVSSSLIRLANLD